MGLRSLIALSSLFSGALSQSQNGTVSSSSAALPGATVITGTAAGGLIVTQTFIPTTYTKFTTLTAVSTFVTTQTETISTVTVNGKTSTTAVPLPTPLTSTITLGPSGVAWAPYNIPSGASALSPPSDLPGGVAAVVPSSSGKSSVVASSSSAIVPSSGARSTVSSLPPPSSSSGSRPPPLSSASGSAASSSSAGAPPSSSSSGSAAPPSSSSSIASNPPSNSTVVSASSSSSAGSPSRSSLSSSAISTAPSSISSGSAPPSSSSSNAAPPPSSSGSDTLPFLTITDVAILTVPTVDPKVTDNTATSTSDDHHPLALFPFVKGGPKCFFCPPGIDKGGFVLWGFSKPGIYKPPVPPPVPSVPWPTITIGRDMKPTPGPNPEEESPESKSNEQSSSQASSSKASSSSSGCSTATASSCAVSCATPSGKSTQSCSTVSCVTTSGCSVSNVASTSSGKGSCPTNWADIASAGDDSDGKDGGDIGADPSYSGSVPAWVTAWPTAASSAASSASSGASKSSSGASSASSGASKSSGGSSSAPVTTSPPAFCWPYAAPREGKSYCTCSDNQSRSFIDDRGNCPTTSGASGVIPTPTPEAPKTDSNGNVWNSTDIVAGTIWGCKSTEVAHGIAPVPITKCLGSSSIGMDFTPPPPAPTSSSAAPAPAGPACKEGECGSDMGASNCGANDPGCLVAECQNNEQCKACNVDCSIYGEGSLTRRKNALLGRGILSARPQQMSSKLSRRQVAEPKVVERSLSRRGNGGDDKPKEHKDAWKKFAPKGYRYYKMLQEKPLEDVTDPPMCELDEYFESRISGPTAARAKGPLFQKIGITPSESYMAPTVYGPKPGKAKNGENDKIGDFQCTVSGEQGVFFANAINRGEKRDASGAITQKGIAYSFSTVAWWMWKHAVMKGQDSAIKEADTDFSKFNYFFSVNIDNPETAEILEEAIGSSTDAKEFTPEDEGPDNAFWPLLGSPNGNTIAWLLADHKKTLKGKMIEKITAWFNGEDYYIWATIK